MDKLRKLFNRKGRKQTSDDVPRTPPAAKGKRERSIDDTAPDGPRIDTSPSKRARRSSGNFQLPELHFHKQKPRIDSHSGSNGSEPRSSITQAEAPKLDYKPGITDFSTVFASLSVDNLAMSPPRGPQPRPLGATNKARQDSASAKRSSLPPQALFSRGLKRWSEGFFEDATSDGASQRDTPTRTSEASGRGAVASSTMTLDDLLNRPLFEDTQPTEQTTQAPAAKSESQSMEIEARPAEIGTRSEEADDRPADAKKPSATAESGPTEVEVQPAEGEARPAQNDSPRKIEAPLASNADASEQGRQNNQPRP